MGEDGDDLDILIEEHRKELMAIRDFEVDLDFAYQLQMEEAMIASMALQPSSSSPVWEESDKPSEMTKLSDLQTVELDKFQQERKDREQCEAEMKRITYDIKLRVHDQKFAQEVFAVPEDEWEEHGDYYEKPFGEGSSSGGSSSFISDEPFRLYFKGLMSDEGKVKISGIGVAVCDPKDNLLLKIQKPLMGDWKNVRVVELKALIEGLNAALTLGIKRIDFFCVNNTNYRHVIGRWTAKQTKVIALLNQVFHLQTKFESCRPVLVTGNDLKFVFKFARDAIDSQITKSLESSMESSNGKNLNESCSICLEDTDVSKMFAVDGCLHRYCFSCMKQHVEVKLLHGMVPACPHDGCYTKLSLDTSRKFLPPKLVEMMSKFLQEASIPVTEKLYCPYPKCSILMSKSEALAYTNNFFREGANQSGLRKCFKCHGLFCINCKVPWHSNMACHEYKRSNISRYAEETKLKSLATQKFWRQCVKCNHMIELADGCYHMTCRCGYEFCYTCGAEWKDKKQTCACPLWDEENILYAEEDDDDEDGLFEDEYEYEDDESESDEFERMGWHYCFERV